MDNKLFKGVKLNDFRDLVKKYKSELADTIAFEYKENPASTEHIKIKYSQFAEDIESLGTYLLNLNAKKVALISHNRYEWCVSYLAITTAGLIVVPLDKSLPGNEISDLLKRSNADTIIYSKEYEDSISLCKNKLCMDDSSYKDALENGKKLSHEKYDSVKINNKEMSIMLFTSGTTSISKAVMLSQYALCMNLYNLSQTYRVPKGTKNLSFLPLHHTFESTITFLYGSSIGITICFCDGLKYISKNLVEFQIDGFVCVPLMLEIMYKKVIKNIEKQGKLKQVNFLRKVFRHAPICVRRKVFKSIIDAFGGHLERIVSGGAPMDKETLQGFSDFGFDIIQGYGLTETASAISVENRKYKRPGSVGLPLAINTIKIDNPDNDGIGEIIVKTESVMLGYYENEEATNSVLKNGWFYTGDLGYIDKDGFIFITGRKKDMIVLKNGKKIFPEEIEMLINNLPYVAESMVFGHNDNTKNDRNEDVILYAEIVYKEEEMKKLYPNATKEDYYNIIFNDIKSNINKKMPAYKYIRQIVITEEPIIKTTTQKIKRFEEIKKINKILK